MLLNEYVHRCTCKNRLLYNRERAPTSLLYDQGSRALIWDRFSSLFKTLCSEFSSTVDLDRRRVCRLLPPPLKNQPRVAPEVSLRLFDWIEIFNGAAVAESEFRVASPCDQVTQKALIPITRQPSRKPNRLFLRRPHRHEQLASDAMGAAGPLF